MVKISIIAAIGKNRELGKNNKLLWHIPEDMKRFRQLTEGHAVIMGRKTFDSIGKPLPNRMNIVITKNPNVFQSINRLNNLIVVDSLDKAVETAKSFELKVANPEIFIIGGGSIYKQAISIADRLYLTIIDGTFNADTFFPDYSNFKKTAYSKDSSDKNYLYSFMNLEKG